MAMLSFGGIDVSKDRSTSVVLSGRRSLNDLKTEQVKRLKDLELENSRLRKALSDLTLDKLILQEAARGNT